MSKEIKNQEPFNLPTQLLLLENKRAEIKAQQGDVSKDLKYLHDFQKQETDILKPIRDKIKIGEASTGDKIKDFCLVCFEGDAEKETQLNDFKKRLEQRPNEFILLKKISPENYFNSLKDRIPSFFEGYHWKENFSLGIIDSRSPLTLDIKKERIIISSPKQISFDDFSHGRLIPIDFSVSLDKYEFNDLGKSIENAYSQKRIIAVTLGFGSKDSSVYEAAKGKKEPAIEITIGDKEVLELLTRKNLLPHLYPQIVKFLGKELKSLTPESEKALLERKKEVFKELQELIKQEKETRSKNESPKTENEQFLYGINETTIKDIKSKLEEAFNLGMHKDPLIIIEKSEPGKKIEFNVPQFISNCCKVYNFVDFKKRLAEETEK